LRVTGCSGVPAKLLTPVTKGEFQVYFFVETYSTTDNDFFRFRDSAGNDGIYFVLMDKSPYNGLAIYSNSVWVSIFKPTENVEYLLQIEWDSDADVFNYTVSNSTWSTSGYNQAFGVSSGALDRLLDICLGRGSVAFIDDFIYRDTKGVYNEPSFVIGEEETQPITPYITVTFNYSSVTYPALSFGTTTPAPNQANGVYNVTVDTNSNYSISANGTDFSGAGYSFYIGNLTMDTNSTAGNLAQNVSVSIQSTPTLIDTNISSVVAVHYHGFWLTIPSSDLMRLHIVRQSL